jgi:hypothetical protein
MTWQDTKLIGKKLTTTDTGESGLCLAALVAVCDVDGRNDEHQMTWCCTQKPRITEWRRV